MHMTYTDKPTLKKIISDAQNVMRDAKHLILIENDEVFITSSENAMLNIIGIIGPAYSQLFGDLTQAVLCEIGIARTRPYVRSEVPKHLRETTSLNTITNRNKNFHLTEHQYKLVAPSIFAIIQQITNAKVSNWKCNTDNPFVMKTPHSYWRRGQRKLVTTERSLIIEPSVRFSVLKEEDFLSADILWGEIFGNQQLLEQLKGKAKQLNIMLTMQRKKGSSRSLDKLPIYADIIDCISLNRIPPYMRMKMLDYIDDVNFRYFQQELIELFGNQSSTFPEMQKAEQALGNPETRLGEMRLRLTNDHSNAKPYYVFEVFANADSSLETDTQHRFCLNDDVPF